MDYLRLPIGDDAPRAVNAVVEIPSGEVNKYEFDPKLQIFRLSRPLYSSVHYPGDYGFIPSTLSPDGDPLDILILVDSRTFTGCIIEARPVGLLDMVDHGKADEKILAVCVQSPLFKEIKEYKDLPPHTLRELEHFFTVYKQLENIETKIRGWHNAAHARKVIMECRRRFEKAQALHQCA